MIHASRWSKSAGLTLAPQSWPNTGDQRRRQGWARTSVGSLPLACINALSLHIKCVWGNSVGRWTATLCGEERRFPRPDSVPLLYIQSRPRRVERCWALRKCRFSQTPAAWRTGGGNRFLLLAARRRRDRHGGSGGRGHRGEACGRYLRNRRAYRPKLNARTSQRGM